MADSTTNLDTISSGQSQKEVTANELFDAGSPATLLGRRASTTAGLTWGYYGGVVKLDAGTLLQVANGTKALANDATNYLELDTSDGSVDINSSGWTAGKRRLYEIVVAGGAVTSYTDWRSVMALVGASSVAAGDVSITDAGGFFTGTDVEAALQELGAAVGGAPAAEDVTIADAGGYYTGADVEAALQEVGASIDALGSQPFDMTGFYPGVPTASAKLLRVPIARAVTFAANFANSVGKASANATGSTAFDIQKNGASVGTMTFAAGASSATFTSSGGAAVDFAAGDVLAVIAPGTPDATLADVGLVLVGTR